MRESRRASNKASIQDLVFASSYIGDEEVIA